MLALKKIMENFHHSYCPLMFFSINFLWNSPLGSHQPQGRLLVLQETLVCHLHVSHIAVWCVLMSWPVKLYFEVYFIKILYWQVVPENIDEYLPHGIFFWDPQTPLWKFQLSLKHRFKFFFWSHRTPTPGKFQSLLRGSRWIFAGTAQFNYLSI